MNLNSFNIRNFQFSIFNFCFPLLLTAISVPSFGATPTARDHLVEGERQLREGMTYKALASCRAAYRLSPRDPDICSALVKASRAILWFDPEDLAALHGQADGLIGLGRCKEALEVCRRNLVLNPYDIEAHAGIGDALWCEGDYEGAMAAYRVAIRIDPGPERARRGFLKASQMAARARQGDADAQYLFALALSGLGRTDRAIAVCEEAVRLNPGHAEALYLYGVLLSQKGRPEKAFEAYSDAARIAPDYAEAQYGIGNGHRDAGRFEEAVTSYRRAVLVSSDYGAAYVNLGNVYREIERFEDAVSAYRKAIGVQPGLVEAYNNLGNLYTERGQFDEATSVYREAIRVRPEFTGSYYNLGVAYASSGRWERAEEVFNDALRISPGDLRIRDAIQIVKAQKRESERGRVGQEVRREQAIKAGKIRLSMILASSREKGAAMRARIGKGGKFQGQDLGFVLPSDMEHQIYEAIKDLKIGELSGMVETKKGFFLFKRTE